MTRLEVRRVTIEYKDGTTKIIEVEGMFHKQGNNYPGGGHPNPKDRWISHEIRWAEEV